MSDKIESALTARIQALLPPSSVIGANGVAAAPVVSGAYALLIHLPRAASFPDRFGDHTFAPGWYIYAGSARGPGGLRSRLRRHLCAEKKIHWHVDHLTTVADKMLAVAVEHGEECGIVVSLIRSGMFSPALAGFGSSDCRRCASHLLECRDRELRPPKASSAACG